MAATTPSSLRTPGRRPAISAPRLPVASLYQLQARVERLPMRLVIVFRLVPERAQVHHCSGEELRQTVMNFKAHQPPIAIAHFQQLAHVGWVGYGMRRTDSLTGHFRLPKKCAFGGRRRADYAMSNTTESIGAIRPEIVSKRIGASIVTFRLRKSSIVALRSEKQAFFRGAKGDLVLKP